MRVRSQISDIFQKRMPSPCPRSQSGRPVAVDQTWKNAATEILIDPHCALSNDRRHRSASDIVFVGIFQALQDIDVLHTDIVRLRQIAFVLTNCGVSRLRRDSLLLAIATTLRNLACQAFAWLQPSEGWPGHVNATLRAAATPRRPWTVGEVRVKAGTPVGWTAAPPGRESAAERKVRAPWNHGAG